MPFSAFSLLRIASISSLVNVSLVTYNTFLEGLFSIIKCAIACIRCVLPSPTPPYINRGLYTSPGDSATAKDAAWARLLLLNDLAVLTPGMVTSDEPGVYADGRFGIRIENEIIVTEDKENEYGRWLKFEMLTMVLPLA